MKLGELVSLKEYHLEIYGEIIKIIRGVEDSYIYSILEEELSGHINIVIVSSMNGVFRLSNNYI